MKKWLATTLALILSITTIPATDAFAQGTIETVQKKEQTETVSLDLTDDVLKFGGFPSENATSDNLDEGERIQLQDDLAEAIDGHDVTLEVSEYGLSADEIEQNVADVINYNPTFFDIKDVSVVYDEDTEIVSEIKFAYRPNYDSRDAEFENAVEDILAAINSSWSDEEKLFYLHDYLVTHCQYDLTYSKYTAYDAIVGHSAVCQGYAEAFEELANRAGIETELVSSKTCNHAWNLVTLNGNKYYVDCTWDDPITGSDSHEFTRYCRHKNFLGSQGKMVENGHTGSDWVLTSDWSNIYGKYNDTKYDDASWREADHSPVACLDDGILYLDASENKIYSYDCKGGQVKEKAVFSSNKWPVYGGGGSYYLVSFGTLSNYGNIVYANDYNSIYKLELSSGKLTSVYTLTGTEQSVGQIFGIELEGSKIRYDIGTDYRDTDFVRSGYVDVTSDIGTPESSVTITPNNYIELDAIGAKVTLKAEVIPAGADTVKWSSSDESVATVSDGVVTQTGFGYAKIYAKARGKTAVCVINAKIRKPVIKAVASTKDGMKITWDKIEGVDGYQIYSQYGEYGVRGVALIDGADTVSCVDDYYDLIDGQKYIYYMYAYKIVNGNDEIRSDYSDTKEGYYFAESEDSEVEDSEVEDSKIETPEIEAVANVGNGLKITWSKIQNADGYTVFRKLSSGSLLYMADIDDAGTVSYIDRYNLINGEKYYYIIEAYGISDDGGLYWSDYSDAKACYFLSEVNVKSVKNKASKSLTVTWAKNAKGSGYQIQYSTNKNFKNAKTITVSSAKTTSKKITKLKKNQTYYVRVRPYKKADKTKYYGAWTKYSKGVKIKK